MPGVAATGAKAPTRRETATADAACRNVFFAGDAASREGVAWRAAWRFCPMPALTYDSRCGPGGEASPQGAADARESTPRAGGVDGEGAACGGGRGEPGGGGSAELMVESVVGVSPESGAIGDLGLFNAVWPLELERLRHSRFLNP